MQSLPTLVAAGAVVRRGEKILLQQRSDDASWGLPGGRLEPGETFEQAARRELREETGLVAGDLRLLDIYSGPEFVVRYPDGFAAYVVGAIYEARETTGTLRLDGDETLALGWFADGDSSVTVNAFNRLLLQQLGVDIGAATAPPSATTAAAERHRLPIRFTARPKQHRDPQVVAAKRERLWEPHVAQINTFVDQIRCEIAERIAVEHRGGLVDQVHVPYIDPDSGGVHARVLLLLESPARPAALGSGMLSADNNDETAKNIWHAYAATGLPRTHGLHWNAVPWFVGSESANAGVSGDQVRLGNDYLLRLLDLAPDIDVLLAMGLPAQAAARRLAGELASRGVTVIDVIHPSPRNYNTAARQAEQKIHAAFRQALSITGG